MISISKEQLYANASKRALTAFHFTLEFVIFVIPAICVCTVFNDRKYLYLGLFVTWILLLVTNRLQANQKNRLSIDVLFSISFRRQMTIFWRKKRLIVGERDSLLLSEEWLSSIRTKYGSSFIVIDVYRFSLLISQSFPVNTPKRTYLDTAWYYILVLVVLRLDGYWCWNVHLHEWSGEWNQASVDVRNYSLYCIGRLHISFDVKSCCSPQRWEESAL